MTRLSSPDALSPRPIADGLEPVAERAASLSPYLSRLLERHRDWLDLSGPDALARQFEEQVAFAESHRDNPQAPADLEQALRLAKQRVHLALSLLDLSGIWSQENVTRALTRFADASLAAALASALASRELQPEGLFIFAFGKMGAFELNYSSDIDLGVFFDPEVFQGGRKGPQDGAIRVVQDVCRIMEAQTADGYVFRTDLRLRPDPGATPVAVSTRRAEAYYESVGQNWERMAWIKARPCAGDLEAAAGLQAALSPFVWRKHLDYWAVADVHAIKRMINAKVGEDMPGAVDCDVKLGPGGIREIEFYVQTQQVILGGRDERLQVRGTLEALTGLVQAGCVPEGDAHALADAYAGLRALEHRIQMLADAQTHTLPADLSQRTRVAGLMGMASPGDLDEALLAVRKQVHAIYSDLFASEAALSEPGPPGNLVFTGVDDDPGTVATLASMGFANPSQVISAFRRWHRGHVAATRTARGQALLTAMTPRLLQAMSDTGDPTSAFLHFERFFEGLNAGVHLLSMLNMEEDLMGDLVSSLAVAPRLARTLARRPVLLESLITRETEDALEIEPGSSFEAAMDAARRYHRDQEFLIGHALLNGRLAARDAAAAWSNLARQMVRAMADAAVAETDRKFGRAGGSWSVLGMGSFGACELTAGSDLDMIVIYEPDDTGGAQDWFTRFTQRLTTALSAPTGEGTLYEVDMRLRPSGRAGPVAVRLSAFERYQNEEAWTWEHMALTRMAYVAGCETLAQRASEIAWKAIDARRHRTEVPTDIDEMRERLRAERPPAGPWDIKLHTGGLVDIEFYVQKRLLIAGGPGALTPNTHDALQQLEEAGIIDLQAGATLAKAWTFFTALRQVLKLCLTDTPGQAVFPMGLKSRLCRAVAIDTFEEVEAELHSHYSNVTSVN
jgi:[glutamine synthetase] adenylyltransferase / [glutamine synthetase]-adenylyl-L-tyrosine phosphorylase